MVRPALMKTAAASLAGQKLWTRVFLFLADSPFVLTLSSPALQIFLHLPACSLSSMSSPAHNLIFHLPANQPLDHPHPPPAPPTGNALCPACLHLSLRPFLPDLPLPSFICPWVCVLRSGALVRGIQFALWQFKGSLCRFGEENAIRRERSLTK